jgi:hypothetical protein
LDPKTGKIIQEKIMLKSIPVALSANRQIRIADEESITEKYPHGPPESPAA